MPRYESPKDTQNKGNQTSDSPKSGPANLGAARLPFQQGGNRFRLHCSEALTFRATNILDLLRHGQPANHHTWLNGGHELTIIRTGWRVGAAAHPVTD